MSTGEKQTWGMQKVVDRKELGEGREREERIFPRRITKLRPVLMLPGRLPLIWTAVVLQVGMKVYESVRILLGELLAGFEVVEG